MSNTEVCCGRFRDFYEDGTIVHAEEEDETEWYVNGFAHLYYCPFCGKNIKGEGFGNYDQMVKREQSNNHSG